MYQILKENEECFLVGTYEVRNGAVNFDEINRAKSLHEALEMAEYYNDENFKMAKYEIDLIGGIASAKDILAEMKETGTIAIAFKKDKFDQDSSIFMNAEQHGKFLSEYFDKNKHQDLRFFVDLEIKRNLHTIRCLEF